MYTLAETEPGTVVTPPPAPSIVKQKAFWIGLVSGLVVGVGGLVGISYMPFVRRRRSR